MMTAYCTSAFGHRVVADGGPFCERSFVASIDEFRNGSCLSPSLVGSGHYDTAIVTDAGHYAEVKGKQGID